MQYQEEFSFLRDIEPMSLIYEVVLRILKMYVQAVVNFLLQGFQKFRALQTDRQTHTDRQTRTDRHDRKKCRIRGLSSVSCVACCCRAFQPVLPHIQLLWELVLTGEVGTASSVAFPAR